MKVLLAQILEKSRDRLCIGFNEIKGPLWNPSLFFTTTTTNEISINANGNILCLV